MKILVLMNNGRIIKIHDVSYEAFLEFSQSLNFRPKFYLLNRKIIFRKSEIKTIEWIENE